MGPKKFPRMLHHGAWPFLGGGYLYRGASIYCIFWSYSPINAMSNFMYPIRHSQFPGKNGLGCPTGYLGWMYAWVQIAPTVAFPRLPAGFAFFWAAPNKI